MSARARVATAQLPSGAPFKEQPLAFADLPGDSNSLLTASDGTNAVQIAGKPAIKAPVRAVDASWAPDGSRALFVSPGGPHGPQLLTLRHNDPTDVNHVRDSVEGREYASPTWLGDGSRSAWAARQDGGPWKTDLDASEHGTNYVAVGPPAGYHHRNPNGSRDGSVYLSGAPRT